MANTLREKLIDHLQDAHAMEAQVLSMLDHQIAAAHDPEMKRLLQMHRDSTHEQSQRLTARLRDLGASASTAADAGARLSAWTKRFADLFRSGTPSRHLHDAYITEHTEIASYEILERLARRAGDDRTADLAHLNKSEEHAMARRLADFWDRAVDRDLLEAGLDHDARGVQTGSYGTRADAAERGRTWGGEESYEADMGIGVHGQRVPPETDHDVVQGNVPTTPGDVPERGTGPVDADRPRGPRTIGEVNQQQAQDRQRSGDTP